MPRVEGRAQVHTLDFVTAQARAASDSGAASVVDHASALLEYDAAIKALSVKQVRQLCGHGWESGGRFVGAICHECAGVRACRFLSAKSHELFYGQMHRERERERER